MAVRAQVAGQLFFLLAATLVACRSAPLPQPPNLLLISLDTVRQDVLGSYGHRPRHAPALPTSPALDHFRERYTALARLRSARPRGSALPERVRRNLEALGYLDSSANPAFSEPDVTLPPPGGSGVP